jgi:hypothetical protein
MNGESLSLKRGNFSFRIIIENFDDRKTQLAQMFGSRCCGFAIRAF